MEPFSLALSDAENDAAWDRALAYLSDRGADTEAMICEVAETLRERGVDDDLFLDLLFVEDLAGRAVRPIERRVEREGR